LVNLEWLGLGSNQLTGSIPSSLGNLVNLQSIGLGSNQLTGPIPAELGNLVNLQTIGLGSNQLTGPIPAELGNLVNLEWLGLGSNQLTGSIPSSLGNLVNLQSISFTGNTGLYGTFTPQCRTTSGVIPSVFVSGTKVIICGCAAASTPPATFPPAGTPDACLATGPALTLSKRILAFSQVIGDRRFTCNTDDNKNPYADCTNTMAVLCNTTDPTWDSTKKANCHTGVNTMYGAMNPWWKAVRKNCGQWPFTLNGITSTEVYPSTNCNDANSNLIANAYYTAWNSQKRAYENIPVTSGLTESIKERLWNNALLA